MKEDTIVDLLKTQCQKLLGNVASYSKFKDKFDFFAKVDGNLETIKELYADLKEVRKNG